jgi:hypothetical protein
MPNTKPYVAAAFLCERAIRGDDEVVSITRIVDTYTVVPQEVPEGRAPVVELTLFVALKSGDVLGQSHVVIRPRSSGTPDTTAVTESGEIPIVLNGGEHGANIIMTLVFPAAKMGLFWLDVLWNDQFLTSVPLKLVQGVVDSATTRGGQG